MKIVELCTAGFLIVGCAAEPPPPTAAEPAEEEWLPEEPSATPAVAEVADPDPVPQPVAAPEQSTAVVVASAAAAVPAAKPSGRKARPVAKPTAEATPTAVADPPMPIAPSEPALGEPAPSDPASQGASAPAPPAVAPQRSEPKPTAAERLSGHYRYAGGAAQKTKLADAVESVVQQMNIVSRGIARRRLLKGAEPPRSLKIGIDGKTVKTNFDGRAYQAKLGGGSVKVTGSSGDPLDFKVRMRGNQLMLEFRGRKGGKKYVMRVDDRGRLRMRVTIYSSSLPDKIVYELTYRDA